MNTKIKDFVESNLFTKFIIYLIILNGITMGLETSKSFMLSFGDYALLFNPDYAIGKFQSKQTYYKI